MKRTNNSRRSAAANDGGSKGILKINIFALAALLMTALMSAGIAVATSDTVAVHIAPWYPQGSTYVFVCDTSFMATSYGWNFGDGQYLYGITNQDVYHTYASDGEYEVVCTVSDDTHSKASILRVAVGSPPLVPPSEGASASLDIAPYFPQGENGENYVFICNAQGFEATSYDWDFGDGQKLYDQRENNIWHTFQASGQYQVDCTASDGITRVQQSKLIVRGIPEEPTVVEEATVSMVSGFPQGNDVVIRCDTEAFDAVSYTWYFGDGQKLMDMSSSDVWHTYDSAGNYTAECDAKDEMGLRLAKGSLAVSVNGEPS